MLFCERWRSRQINDCFKAKIESHRGCPRHRYSPPFVLTRVSQAERWRAVRQELKITPFTTTPIDMAKSKQKHATAEEAGKVAGVHPLVIMAIAADGSVPSGATFGHEANSLDELGAQIGVSRRTLTTWRKNGCPIPSKGPYYAAPVIRWRRDYEEEAPSDEYWTGGNPNLRHRHASGDLFRAMCRLLRVELKERANAAAAAFLSVADMVPNETSEDTYFRFMASIASQFETFILTDEEIEEALEKLWTLV